MQATPTRLGSHSLTWVALGLVAALSLPPLFFESRPVQFVPPYRFVFDQWCVRAEIVAILLLTVALRSFIDRRHDPREFYLSWAMFAAAGLMTAWHWYSVDMRARDVNWEINDQTILVKFRYVEKWQRDTYLAILNHEQAYPDGQSVVPHVFRPLPYGFTRTLELATRDWSFSCLIYRWYFTFWFLWASYQFVRLFHGLAGGLLALGVLFVLCPLSIRHYWGQLTDPLSHTLFVLALIYAVKDRWLPLAAALVLGVLAKETVVIMVPAYLACHGRQGWQALLKTGVLGLACVAAFVAARLPLGWRPGYETINGTPGLMIGTNLGIGPPIGLGVTRPYLNYLLPALFVVSFLPLIIAYWRQIDARLKAVFLVLTPLLLASNLCFGWMYECRNYMPLLPVLAGMALTAGLMRFSVFFLGLTIATAITMALPHRRIGLKAEMAQVEDSTRLARRPESA